MPPPLPDYDESYVRTHRQRYALLVDVVRSLNPETVLVVGPGHESMLLRDVARAGKVDTLGWADYRYPRVEGERHVEHDLNDSDYPALDRYDVVVCAEVIEHLHVSPLPLFRYLADRLVPGGSLIIQTPNATALPKRVRMLLGRNPYEPLRAAEASPNPGHFHEYTVGELRDAIHAAGLEVERLVTANYFDHGSRKNRVYRAVEPVLPSTLREGITFVARRSR